MKGKTATPMTVDKRFWSFTRMALCVAFLLALVVAACGDKASCQELRDRLTASKRAWQKCQSDLDCIKVFGNKQDCTGIVSCDFSVNRKFHDEAENTVARMADESTMCHVCGVPNCVDGEISVCEPVTGECFLVTAILDGGYGSSTEPPPREDAGVFTPPPTTIDSGVDESETGLPPVLP
jgi:hypothetical protein